MAKSLLIVESPTKARTISKFLPKKDFVVESSIGHIRDLPNSAKEIPEKLKGESWARLGIDIENDFEPLYVIPAEKKKQVSKLKSLLKEADHLFLATDEDREGESISWHLCEVLKPRIPRRRLVFHEITREAIREALANPREIDERMVRAQETRRLVDRLYGYEISPLLWRKIAPRLSAGRVQSVAVRILVQRERQRRRFVSSVYWDLVGTFQCPKGSFQATLIEVGKRRVASGKDFDETSGQLKDTVRDTVVLLGEDETAELRQRLQSASWRAVKVERKPYVTRPAPPFTTSTLQQEANRKLRLSAKATMQAAQRLYENGHITYMRTDSVTLSDQAIQRAREVVKDLYGDEYLAGEPRRYKTKVKNAQEAHEAIRPSAEFLRPEELRDQVGPIELKLYELIWKRTVACQMSEARGHRLVVQVADDTEDEASRAVFQASGKTIEFSGFLRAYVEGADDPEAELADKETALPDVAVGEPLDCTEIAAKDHTTQPPPRYTEATLVKELEANGVGRPSTYALIIDTIQRREYVVKQGNALVPTFTAFAVVQLLERFFDYLVDIQFTARMEDDLDSISLGEMESLPYLRTFYFGNGHKAGLHDLVKTEIDARESCTLYLATDKEGRVINVRVGRYGPYLERGDERASIPMGMAPDELNLEKAEDLLARGSGQQELGEDPETGKVVYAKVGRYGPYVQLGDNADGKKPKMKSLLPGMEPEEVTLDTALKLLSLPRALGKDPESGEEVFADFGRYGPYVKRGDESRSLTENDNVLDVDLDRALHLFKQEKPKGGWRRFQSKVLKEFEKAGENEKTLRVLVGRYGPYVTDGETNAPVPRGRNPEEITLEEARDLVQEKALTKATTAGKKRTRAKKKKASGQKEGAGAGKNITRKKSAKKTAKKTAAKKAKKTRSKKA